MVVPEFPETEHRLREDVDDGLFTRGAQISVRVGGDLVLDLALGDDGCGRPMSTTTIMRVYCAIKPVTALAIAKLVERGVVALDTPMVDVLPGPVAFADGRVTLRHVLNHTAGVQFPMALDIEVVAPDKREAIADRRQRPTGWQVGTQAAYSEWYGWHLLGRAITALTGDDLRDHLRAEVLDPLGLTSTWIGMTDAEYRAVLDRMGTNLDMRTLKAYPLLLERGQRMCTEVNPSHGGYSTANDLSLLYSHLLAARAGQRLPGLPSPDLVQQFTSAQRPADSFDEVLDRTCSYGFGFMTDLEHHLFGSSTGPRSFGHSGNVGSTFGFADESRDVAVAVVFNGVVDAESAFLRRPALVNAIARDLDAAAAVATADDAGGADAETETPPNERRRRGRVWRRS